MRGLDLGPDGGGALREFVGDLREGVLVEVVVAGRAVRVEELVLGVEELQRGLRCVASRNAGARAPRPGRDAGGKLRFGGERAGDVDVHLGDRWTAHHARGRGANRAGRRTGAIGLTS